MTDQSFPLTQAALLRLEQAILHLEAALAEGRSSGDLMLQQELEAARADYRALQQAATSVQGRLDGVIERLRVVLDEEEA